MKKFITLFILFNFLGLSATYGVEDFLLKYLDKNLTISKQQYEPIKDNFAQNSLNKNLKIKLQKQNTIKDEFVEQTLPKNLKIQKQNQKNNKENAGYIEPSILKFSPVKYYSTRFNLQEGKYINLILVQDFTYKNKIFKKGTRLKARVENINPNGIYGLPSDLVIGNFTLEDNTKLEGEFTTRGANRSLWVYPTIHTLSMFFGMGYVFIPIRGGHAKLKPQNIYEVEVY